MSGSTEDHEPQASTSKAIMSPALSEQDKQATETLLESLYGFGKQPTDGEKLAKLLRHTDHHVPRKDGTADDAFTITSWKMQDYAYKRDPCPYPTRARGLFTMGRKRIVARAYDKFFNVDEVSWTKWSNLPDLTAAPYYLTLKSNGCLILIAAISPTQLLVTSKHAIGKPGQEEAVSHAQVGEVWLERGLKKAGKDQQALAHRLWTENLTLVAELCDDSFEEHVLAYPPELTGLHLHGAVFNHPTLLVLPPPEVNNIAAEFGFIETDYVTLQSVEEVRQFRQQVVDNDGMWKGQHVEGFVARAALKPGSLEKQPHPNDLTEQNWQDPRRVFMWKIKFDEPYLMWREWRETTKKILNARKKDGDDVAQRGKAKSKPKASKAQNGSADSGLEEAFRKATLTSGQNQGGAGTSIINEAHSDVEEPANNESSSKKLPQLPSTIKADKIRNPETRLYAVWVEQYMDSNPEAFTEYNENRGIVAVRESFTAWRATPDGIAMADRVLSKSPAGKAPAAAAKTAGGYEKTLIVPVAVPGCGKTVVGVALSHLFNFMHTQSDDIKEKKAAKHFESQVAKLLQDNPVVFADKNNHLKQHRQAMVDIARQSKHKTRLVALVWPLTKHPQNEIHRICSDRIVARGENHQSLRPVKTGEHEVILMRFFSQMDPFDPAFNACDGPFDDIIEMDIAWDMETAVKHAVDALCTIDAQKGGIKGIDGRKPTPQDNKQAVSHTLGYKPSIYKEMKVEGLDKSKGIRYYGIAVEVDLTNLLDGFFKDNSGKADRTFFDTLRDKDRIEQRPHVTLVHQTELKRDENEGSDAAEKVQFAKLLWERCQTLSQRWGSDAITVQLVLGPLLCWDSRVMSIQVSSVKYAGLDIKAEDLPSDRNKASYHITVGTLNQDIRPFEGKLLVESAIKEETDSKAGGAIRVAETPTTVVSGRVRGLY